MSKIDPLKRLTGESEGGWLAYRMFLELEPPRSFEVLAKKTGLKVKTLTNYSFRYRWKERAAAWDESIARAEAKEILKRAGQLAIDKLDEFGSIRKKAFVRLVGSSKDELKGLLDDEKATLRAVVSAYFEAEKAESLALKEAMERIEFEDDSPWNLEALTAEELETFIALVEKARARVPEL